MLTNSTTLRGPLGRTAHVVFMILCLVNNIFACANMLLGAAAVISAVYVPELYLGCVDLADE